MIQNQSMALNCFIKRTFEIAVSHNKQIAAKHAEAGMGDFSLTFYGSF